jgi:hypothetical protein
LEIFFPGSHGRLIRAIRISVEAASLAKTTIEQ